MYIRQSFEAIHRELQGSAERQRHQHQTLTDNTNKLTENMIKLTSVSHQPQTPPPPHMPSPSSPPPHERISSAPSLKLFGKQVKQEAKNLEKALRQALS
jgi:hypothetical protein